MADPVLDATRVAPGQGPGLASRDPAHDLGYADKAAGEEDLARLIRRLAVLQNRLWAESSRSVLLVLQGMDTAGKDGAIREVFTGVNPQGCEVHAFKAPSETELAHDFLRRVHAVCPARGRIGIFNRSHYEDVVAVRVRSILPEDRWRPRYRHIRDFEQLLSDEGTAVVKVFLHISKDEQRERLQARLDDPEKRWKFRVGDLDDRARWDEFQAAYEEAITLTSTQSAPWHVVPADRKWVRNAAVARLMVACLEDLDPQLPAPTAGIENVQIDA